MLGDDLTVSLNSRNMGNSPVTISQALHSYFAVSDVRQARVEGVEGLQYIETLADWEQRQQQGVLGFAGETDRIYLDTPQQLSIVDPHWARRISLTCNGSRSAVIWNPGPNGPRNWRTWPMTAGSGCCASRRRTSGTMWWSSNRGQPVAAGPDR